MSIDYKKELETAAKSMILVHEPDILIKIIARTIMQKAKVSHAGILLHEKDRDTYILTVSRGPLGLKIPKGFARMDADNPLIRFFRERKDKQIFGDGAIISEKAKRILRRRLPPALKKLLKGTLYQMEIFAAEVAIASYFRNDLLGILLLGRKTKGKKFSQDEIDFFVALASDVAMAIRNARLFKDLQLELEKEHRLFLNTTIALAAAIDAKDHYTHGHTARVTSLSLEIARTLSRKNNKKLNEKFLEYLHISSLLHDIGKIGIPEVILNKEGPLSPEERNKMEGHPALGANILKSIPELGEAILGVKYHHERYDGSGYPQGLKKDQIPLIASIISVADTFDAMTTDRPYRRALNKDGAIEEIKRSGGKQFDPKVVSALVKLYREGKI
ncbi:MAG: HD-GYP domain-containing protein [Candidatus Omnitrophica bacterium]|nr:HD-GYP domain-containing protein [Candidatus Omnitrophota bacterium]